MLHTEYILLAVSSLLFLCILASKASGRVGVPALLLFLVLGMLAGSDGIGGIYFDNPDVAQFIGVVALVFILYSSGLDTPWQYVRPVLGNALLLSTAGVFITAALVGWFAHFILHFSWLEGWLLGAIIASTDAAAVFSVMRSRGVQLNRQVKTLIELESASNDPMAVFLTLGMIRLLMAPETSLMQLINMFIVQLIVGAALGFAMGKVIPWIINRMQLEYEGLYPALTISLVLLTYSVTSLIGGNGFLAIYITGLRMGNTEFKYKKDLILFHDAITWLMQIIMFLTLGLLVFPSKLIQVVWPDLLVAIFLMFVARPASVFSLTLFSNLQFKEKLIISWVGLRGAVPIILATFPLVAGVPKADMIFNLIFFIVLTSMLVQGTSIPWIAKFLKVNK